MQDPNEEGPWPTRKAAPEGMSAEECQAVTKPKFELRNWKQAFCSWCYEETVHYCVPLVHCWLCDACKGRTTPSRTCRDSMARIQAHRRPAICAKADKQWQQRLARKRQVLAADRTLNELKYHMMRDSPARQMAQKEGLLRPFLLLVSMSAALRSILGVQLGICALSEDHFGDAHQEAWQLLAHPEAGLRARCRSAWDRINPFGGFPSWLAILTFVAQTHFVPSYLAWHDLFTSEKLSKAEAAAESAGAHSRKVAAFEDELLVKLGKQQRCKLNKFQVSFIDELRRAQAVKGLLTQLALRGWDNHHATELCVDACYIQVARDKFIQGQETIHAVELAAALARFLSVGVAGDEELREEGGLPDVLAHVSADSVVGAFFEPLWLLLGTLQLKPCTEMACVMPVCIQILLQRERLKILKVNLDSKDFQVAQ